MKVLFLCFYKFIYEDYLRLLIYNDSYSWFMNKYDVLLILKVVVMLFLWIKYVKWEYLLIVNDVVICIKNGILLLNFWIVCLFRGYFFVNILWLFVGFLFEYIFVFSVFGSFYMGGVGYERWYYIIVVVFRKWKLIMWNGRKLISCGL